jgi:hypothetical protein
MKMMIEDPAGMLVVLETETYPDSPAGLRLQANVLLETEQVATLIVALQAWQQIFGQQTTDDLFNDDENLTEHLNGRSTPELPFPEVTLRNPAVACHEHLSRSLEAPSIAHSHPGYGVAIYEP